MRYPERLVIVTSPELESLGYCAEAEKALEYHRSSCEKMSDAGARSLTFQHAGRLLSLQRRGQVFVLTRVG